MSNESENKLARRADDKRADRAVDWTDAPRFTVLGIAETWSVTVEAEGQRVVSISDEHVAGLDGERLDQFVPTIRSCAQHLLGFIGAAPMSSTAGAAKGGITTEAFEEIAQSWDGLRYDNAMIDDIGAALRRDFDRLATTAGEQAEPASAELKRDRDRFERMFMAACEDLGAISDALGIDSEIEGGADPILDAIDELKAQAAPASPEQVQATIDTPHFNQLLGRWMSARDYYQSDDAEQVKSAWSDFIAYIDAILAPPSAAAPAAPKELSDEHAQIINQQVASWTRERDRLQDLIDTATGRAAAPAAEEVQDELKRLRNRVSELEAARIAYASEFPPNADGDPEVSNIHANIRALKAHAAEEVRNQVQVDAIMDAIQHACGELPVGYEVILEMENGAGGVVWTDDEGERHVIDGDGYISQDIHKAVERAIEHASMKRAASTEGDAA